MTVGSSEVTVTIVLQYLNSFCQNLVRLLGYDGPSDVFFVLDFD